MVESWKQNLVMRFEEGKMIDLSVGVLLLTASLSCLVTFLILNFFQRKNVRRIQRQATNFEEVTKVTEDWNCSVASERTQHSLYTRYVNPRWSEFMDVLEMNVEYEQCLGTELFTPEGKRILDFVSSYSVQNAGHNNPYIIEEIVREVQNNRPAILHCCYVPEIAGELGKRLIELAGGNLKKVCFGNTGSEGIEIAIKFCRATTKRDGMIYLRSAFHGLTMGSLSLSTEKYWYEGFGTLLPETVSVELGDIIGLEALLKTRQYAGFIIEPIMAEAGVLLPTTFYLQKVQQLCRKYDTMFVVDEVQTGIFRTGPFLASHHHELDPDIVVLAKALSGGLIPIAAVLMQNHVYNAVFTTSKKSYIQFSTFGENKLAMRAGIATLDVMRDYHLQERAQEEGSWFLSSLRIALQGFSIVKEVRGQGFLCGIEFQLPSSLFSMSSICMNISYLLARGIFVTVIVKKLYKEKNILTQVCANNYMVLKVSPPITTTREQLEEFIKAIKEVVKACIETPDEYLKEAKNLIDKVTERL
jgi:ornithine--oxo-acid transaminase